MTVVFSGMAGLFLVTQGYSDPQGNAPGSVNFFRRLAIPLHFAQSEIPSGFKRTAIGRLFEEQEK